MGNSPALLELTGRVPPPAPITDWVVKHFRQTVESKRRVGGYRRRKGWTLSPSLNSSGESLRLSSRTAPRHVSHCEDVIERFPTGLPSKIAFSTHFVRDFFPQFPLYRSDGS